MSCPKCKTGTVLKGSTAYGCSEHAAGCDFRVSFELIRSKAMGKPLDKDLVADILKTS